tara:strand:+ start:10293 stop:10430 length:138 start_codon:yes stop_codon:yes gene_type:complete
MKWREYISTTNGDWKQLITETIKKGKTEGMPLEVMELLKKIKEEN